MLRYRKFSCKAFPLRLLLLLSACLPAAATSVTLDFEGFSDGDVLSNQVAGLTFSNAVILTAGISLNEFEFPPHSGLNVISDNGGPLSITFGSPVTSVGGYFTYAAPLTLSAFDILGNLLGATNSTFSGNEALSGDLGSSPNELIQLISPGDISSISISGDPSGGSFALDDLAIALDPITLPEPLPLPLILVGFAGFLAVNKTRSSMNKTILYYAVLVLGLVIIGGVGHLLGRPSNNTAINPLRATGPRLTPTLAVPNGAVPAKAGTVSNLSVMPALLTVNTPTTVTVTARINPAPLSGGVNLLRLATNTMQPTILGTMHDDGRNGDAIAGDGLFTFQTAFNESSAGPIMLQISAAFGGSLKRVLSSAEQINVWQKYSDSSIGVTFSYPDGWIANDGGPYIFFTKTPRVEVLEVSTSSIPEGMTPQRFAQQEILKNNCPGTDSTGQPVDHIISYQPTNALYTLSCSATTEDYYYAFLDSTGQMVQLSYHDDFDSNATESVKLGRFEQIIRSISHF